MPRPLSPLVTHLTVAALLHFGIVGCKRPKSSPPLYPDPAFSALEWKRDSMGCAQYRERTYWSVAKNDSFFRGKPTTFLVHLLGKPSAYHINENNEKIHYFFYVVDCTEIPMMEEDRLKRKPEYSTAGATKLVFKVVQDTCRSVSTMVP